jgi:hypothetical protein
LIHARLSEQPGSAYYLAQTVMVQKQALQAAQQKIQALEQCAVPQTAAPVGQASGFGYGFGRNFAEAPAPAAGATAGMGMGARAVDSGSQGGGLGQRLGLVGQGNHAGQQARATSGGGFMAGAMQTALGVAGGVMLGNMLGGLFGNNAEAATSDASVDASGGDAVDAGGQGLPAQDVGYDDGGGWDDGGGFDDI